MSTAVDDIAIATRGPDSDKASAGAVMFKLASFYAKASSTLTTDPVLTSSDQERLAEQYAASAIRLLNCAEKAGYFVVDRKTKRESLNDDPAFARLRSRADYQRFVERLR
jgi:hypothetical protein